MTGLPAAEVLEFSTIAVKELETAWFDAPRRSTTSSRPRAPAAFVVSRPPTMPPPPPIDDPVADRWFR